MSEGNELSSFELDLLSLDQEEVYAKHREDGNYKCLRCGNRLYSSTDKLDVHSRKPTFRKAVHKDSVKLIDDTSYGLPRLQACCANCNAYLGHVYYDGKPSAGKARHCILSATLKFQPEGEDEDNSEDDETGSTEESSEEESESEASGGSRVGGVLFVAAIAMSWGAIAVSRNLFQKFLSK